MAYQITNGDNSHALGESVDALVEKTATLNTSFSNSGWEEALQNACVSQPGRNLPVWPKGLKYGTRPASSKAPQQAISAQISENFGRPWNNQQNDAGLFISTEQMKPVEVSYTAEAMAQMSPELVAAASTVNLGPPVVAPKMMPQMPPPTSTSPPDADCGFSDPGFSIWKIPSCMVKSLAGISSSKNFFTDHSRYFYLLCWLGVILLVIFLIKKFLIQKGVPSPQNPIFFPAYE